MSAALQFDARSVAPDTGVQDPVPAGWYNVVMDQSEMKPTKDGSGSFLECRFKVMEGQFNGRYVYGRLNLRNLNAQAQDIAYKQLSAICHAVGVLQISDSAQLHNLPLKIKVKLRAATAEYEASNDISAYKNINEQVGSTAAAGFAPPPGAGAPQMPPAPPAPQQMAPQAPQQPTYTPPQQQPQGQWQAPAGQQPWTPQGGQQMQAPVQQQAPAPQQQYAPPPQQQPQAQAPQQQYAPPAQQFQAPQGQTPAPQGAPGAAPAWAGAQGATPPWMQGQQAPVAA